MANTREHNQMMEKLFVDVPHFNRLLTLPEISDMAHLEKRYPYAKLPVCEHCEGMAYWDKGGKAVCPTCGKTTYSPITLSEYYVKGYDLDGTGMARGVKDVILEARQLILPG